MAMPNRVRPKRVLLAAVMLIATLLANSIGAQRASAYISVCDTDPVFVLTNGMWVTLSTHIADNPRDVSRVAYTVHAPIGVALDHVRSWGRLRKVETIQFVADQAPNSYLTDTVVFTGASGVAVTSVATLSQVVGDTPITINSSSTSGSDHQDLYVSLTG